MMNHLTFFNKQVNSTLLFDITQLKVGDVIYRMGINQANKKFINRYIIHKIRFKADVCTIEFRKIDKYKFDKNIWDTEFYPGSIEFEVNDDYMMPYYYICNLVYSDKPSRIYSSSMSEEDIISAAYKYNGKD